MESARRGLHSKQSVSASAELDLGQEWQLAGAGRLQSLMCWMWEQSMPTSCGRLPDQRKRHPTEDSASLLLLLPHL